MQGFVIKEASSTKEGSRVCEIYVVVFEGLGMITQRDIARERGERNRAEDRQRERKREKKIDGEKHNEKEIERGERKIDKERKRHGDGERRKEERET